jgi:hypothetical protein
VALKASRNDASLLETEIASSTWSRSADDNVIEQVDFQDSARFVDPAG